jgi:hypothetical protein
MRDLAKSFLCFTFAIGLLGTPGHVACAGVGEPCWACGGSAADCPFSGYPWCLDTEDWDCNSTGAGPACPDDCYCGEDPFGNGGSPVCDCLPFE